jgi:hypothetical protein
MSKINRQSGRCTSLSHAGPETDLFLGLLVNEGKSFETLKWEAILSSQDCLASVDLVGSNPWRLPVQHAGWRIPSSRKSRPR